MGAMRNYLRVLTGEVLVVEHLALLAGDEPGLSLHAGDEPVAVAGHWEPGERPELRWLGVGGNLGGALEAYDRWNWYKEDIGKLVIM